MIKLGCADVQTEHLHREQTYSSPWRVTFWYVSNKFQRNPLTFSRSIVDLLKRIGMILHVTAPSHPQCCHH